MTGYGRGEASNGKITTAVEIKTVNNRFRDIQIRVPKPYMCLEHRLRKLLSKHLSRGRIEVFIRRESIESAMDVQADPLLAERYYREISAIAKRLQLDSERISLTDIISHSGVLQCVDKEPDALNEWNLVETALEMALIDIGKMREAEGKALEVALLELMGSLQEKQTQIEAEMEDLGKVLLAKLEKKLLRLIGDRIDPTRLAQEAAILVDKADISEELTRLRSHCDQMRHILNSDGPVGRKLEFLLQEFNREINTIGSKAANHNISMHVVDLKSILEKIREQAANIE